MQIKNSPMDISFGEKASKGLRSISGAALTFTSRIGSTCDLGAQTVELTPGASSCCGSGCSSCSSCCW